MQVLFLFRTCELEDFSPAPAASPLLWQKRGNPTPQQRLVLMALVLWHLVGLLLLLLARYNTQAACSRLKLHTSHSNRQNYSERSARSFLDRSEPSCHSNRTDLWHESSSITREIFNRADPYYTISIIRNPQNGIGSH